MDLLLNFLGVINFFLGLLIGLAIGAFFFFPQQKKIKEVNKKAQQARRLLEESQTINQQHGEQIEELKREQERIREFQAEQQHQYQELQKAQEAKVEELASTYESRQQEIEKIYQERFQELELKYQEEIQKKEAEIEGYKNQIQELSKILESQVKTDEDTEDFSREVETETGAPIAEIESFLDLLSEPVSQGEQVTPPVEKVRETPSPASSELVEKISAIGDSKGMAAIPQLLEYTCNSDSKIRALAASTMGKLAQEKSNKTARGRLISHLGQLSRDPDPDVRQSAMVALGQISSKKAIPWLKRGLRDGDSNVVKTASAALRQFKGCPVSEKKKPLAKNARLIQDIAVRL